MSWVLRTCNLRPFRAGDEPSLRMHADDRAVWRNLRDRFPHPYTLADAHAWVAARAADALTTTFAIEVDGAVAGAVGLELQADVFRRSVELGFWLGRTYWGRGIATDAARAVTEWAFQGLQMMRVFAGVFAWNPASMRVLEKAGFHREGVARGAAFKDGEVVDVVNYARVHLPD